MKDKRIFTLSNSDHLLVHILTDAKNYIHHNVKFLI